MCLWDCCGCTSVQTFLRCTHSPCVLSHALTTELVKNPKHWQLCGCSDTQKYGTCWVNSQRRNVAAHVAGQLKALTYARCFQEEKKNERNEKEVVVPLEIYASPASADQQLEPSYQQSKPLRNKRNNPSLITLIPPQVCPVKGTCHAHGRHLCLLDLCASHLMKPFYELSVNSDFVWEAGGASYQFSGREGG